MTDKDYGYTKLFGIGRRVRDRRRHVALGVPLMLACAVKLRPFFRGETLNRETPILVPDTGEPPPRLDSDPTRPVERR